ncbi:MAG: 4Fe-4S dicluster domain-containing protein [Desulfobacteraceae bacterium]|nr:MAG: 4Fe-4S dicluster domain-containing protein [Desulfobacteraceae bacterium]
MTDEKFVKISGLKDGVRVPSRVLEEIVQQQIEKGARYIEVDAYGQHGIGGRLWRAGDEKIQIRITGHSGQRTGSLGFTNTDIEIMGPASDDIGWLNAGANITIHGDASNGAMNGAAQGKVYIAGSIGSRGMTMTKHNPRFEPPELWVLGSCGDYFGEFMAGGIAVICGINPKNETNLLGHRPFVGMVGGKAFVRGRVVEYSQKDAKLVKMSQQDWEWLSHNLELFLKAINKPDLIGSLMDKTQWNIIQALTPQERGELRSRTPMSRFLEDVWERELGRGGLIGDLQEVERGPIPVITKAELRRFVPVWEQNMFNAPCQAACPIGIPIPERWRMVRAENVEEAVRIGLEHTPMPATVCGYLCPSPCMEACTRNMEHMVPIDIRPIGQVSEKALPPKPAKKSKKKIAVIGGGPGGISAAWHLTLAGHTVAIFDENKVIGGKISSVIPESRIPRQVLKTELDRIKKLIPDIRLDQAITKEEFLKIKYDFDFTIIAGGAKKPRTLLVPGMELAAVANEFLALAKTNKIKSKETVVIIGAGNVGCDVATEAHRLGAKDITMIDVQKPAAFGKEKEDALAIGAKFRWPCFTQKITKEGVLLSDGELLRADMVVLSIGDLPDLRYLDKDIVVENDFIRIDEHFRTSDPRVFAVGDAIRPGLITDAIGAGKRAALNIDRIIQGKPPKTDNARPAIDKSRVSLEYFDPHGQCETLEVCAQDCSSCGKCRDCGICVATCPEQAIYRTESKGIVGYQSDPEKCIGCGFCRSACPCGIWNLVPNMV